MASDLHRPRSMLGRWFIGVVALGTLTMACAAPPAKKKAAACDPTVDDCPTKGPRKEKDDGVLVTTTGAPLEAPDHATPSTTDEPDVDLPDDEDIPIPTPRPTEPELGPICTKLKTCCSNLRNAGITGSARQCDTTVSQNDELTCDVANEGYKTPDDFYDPVCF